MLIHINDGVFPYQSDLSSSSIASFYLGMRTRHFEFLMVAAAGSPHKKEKTVGAQSPAYRRVGGDSTRDSEPEYPDFPRSLRRAGDTGHDVGPTTW